MFKIDQEEIAHYAWEREEHILDVLVFVRLTIRQHLYNVPTFMKEYRTSNNMDFTNNAVSKSAFSGMKSAAHDLYINADFYRTHARAVLDRALEIHGLGIVKAGFVAQLLCGKIGCLDSHNVERFNLNPNMFRSGGTPKAVTKRVSSYIKECAWQGGAERLWDGWCEYVATRPRQIKKWPGGAEQVSRLHVETITGRK